MEEKKVLFCTVNTDVYLSGPPSKHLSADQSCQPCSILPPFRIGVRTIELIELPS